MSGWSLFSSGSLSFVPSQRVPSTHKAVPAPGLLQRRFREKGTKVGVAYLSCGTERLTWLISVSAFGD